MIQSQQSALLEFVAACTNSKPMKLPEEFQPRDFDILCGRGRGVWEHPGNRRFKSLIEAQAEKYATARNKMDKGVVVASIVDSIREEGILFVKKDSKSQRWVDIGEYQAREKTSHAMRDHICKRRTTSRNSTQQSKNNAKAVPQQLRKTKRTQQPTVACECRPTSVTSCNNPLLISGKSNVVMADKCVSGESMSTPDIFERLGLDYLSHFEHEKPKSSVYPDGVTSQQSTMTTISGTDDEEALRWSELFPTDVFDRFQLQYSDFAYAA